MGINYINKQKAQQWALPSPQTTRDFFLGSGRRGSLQQLQDFHEYLNNTNSNIKLSLEYSNSSLNFLDLTISVDASGDLHTSIYRKNTDRNTILRADSFHPNGLINNIPYGQFQRLRRICDSQTDFDQQSKSMYQRFRNRGYKANTLNDALSKAKSTERSALLQKRTRNRNNNNKIFCSLQYSNVSNDIKNIIKQNWDILRSDPSLSAVFSEPPSFAIRRAPTLKDKLVKNYLPAPKQKIFWPKPPGTHPCGSCSHCTHINRTTTFKDSSGLKTFHCKHFSTCNTTHVVYRLDCLCGAFYVGLTKRRLKDRFAEHKNAIRINNPNYPMAVHINSSTTCNINQVKVMVLEVIPNNIRGGDRVRTLAQKETFWIDTLHATHPPGLNEDIDFSVFL